MSTEPLQGNEPKDVTDQDVKRALLGLIGESRKLVGEARKVVESLRYAVMEIQDAVKANLLNRHGEPRAPEVVRAVVGAAEAVKKLAEEP